MEEASAVETEVAAALAAVIMADTTEDIITIIMDFTIHPSSFGEDPITAMDTAADALVDW